MLGWLFIADATTFWSKWALGRFDSIMREDCLTEWAFISDTYAREKNGRYDWADWSFVVPWFAIDEDVSMYELLVDLGATPVDLSKSKLTQFALHSHILNVRDGEEFEIDGLSCEKVLGVHHSHYAERLQA